MDILRAGDSCRGGLQVEVARCSHVNRHADAVVIHEAQFVDRRDVAFGKSLFQP